MHLSEVSKIAIINEIDCHQIIRSSSLLLPKLLTRKEFRMIYSECNIHSDTICTAQSSFSTSFNFNLRAWRGKLLLKILMDLAELGTISGFTELQIIYTERHMCMHNIQPRV